LVVIASAPAQLLADLEHRDHPQVRRAFRSVVSDARKATVRVLCDGKSTVLGAVVDAKRGLVVTKASELRGKLACRTFENDEYEAELLGKDGEHDIALLKLKLGKEKIHAVKWQPSTPAIGSFLATTSLGEYPLAIGVVSVAPRKIRHQRGFLGVGLGEADDGPRINEVIPKSAAASAGLKTEDVVTHVNGKEVPNPNAMIRLIGKLRPGDEVKLKVKREEKEIDFNIRLGTPEMNGARADRFSRMNALGGKLSTRRAGFPSALQHDTVLRPDQCGGPIVDLDGKTVGINIARAGRVNSYAIPADELKKIVNRLAK
jgi:serine protease Do